MKTMGVRYLSIYQRILKNCFFALNQPQITFKSTVCEVEFYISANLINYLINSKETQYMQFSVGHHEITRSPPPSPGISKLLFHVIVKDIYIKCSLNINRRKSIFPSCNYRHSCIWPTYLRYLTNLTWL